jgi:hypothetical protein
MMAYSPPLDSAVALFMMVAPFIGIAVFFLATIVEILVLWGSGWGSFLYSLLTSFVVNLASTVIGVVITLYFADKDIAPFGIGNSGNFLLVFILLFFVSLGLEGGIMLGMNRSQHKAQRVWELALHANFVSYIFLGILLIVMGAW